MHIAVMQPYFLPYIGYFQLLAAVDRFVIYDTVEYTKKGWINRNRLLKNGAPALFSLPLRKASDYCDIRDRQLSVDFDPRKLTAQFEDAYRKAPEFQQVMPVLYDILHYNGQNLFAFIQHSIDRCCAYLGITTPIIVASQIEGSHHSKGVERILTLCEKLEADRYTNPIGGLALYQGSVFRDHGITLRFLRSRPEPYPQFGAPFQPFLSIVDVMMFNAPDRIAEMLSDDFEFVEELDGADVPVE